MLAKQIKIAMHRHARLPRILQRGMMPVDAGTDDQPATMSEIGLMERTDPHFDIRHRNRRLIESDAVNALLLQKACHRLAGHAHADNANGFRFMHGHHRIFRVDSATSARSMAIIQKRTMTFGSGHPFSS